MGEYSPNLVTLAPGLEDQIHRMVRLKVIVRLETIQNQILGVDSRE
jgi:hypothetical protein